MIAALRAFFSDLFSTIVFLAIAATTNDATLAIGISIAAGVLQIAVEKLRGRPIATMQWASLGLVLVFGGASLVTHNERFMMIKPTLINFAIAAVMLQKGWLDRYLPQRAHDRLPRSLIIASGYAWSARVFAMGVLNFVVATTCTFKVWAWYTAVVPFCVQIAAFALSYATFRVVGRWRARHSMAA